MKKLCYEQHNKVYINNIDLESMKLIIMLRDVLTVLFFVTLLLLARCPCGPADATQLPVALPAPCKGLIWEILLKWQVTRDVYFSIL